MENRRLGIILIFVGLGLFALQASGIYRDIALLVLGTLALGVYWFQYRTEFVLVGSLLMLALGIQGLLDISGVYLLGLLAIAFFLAWLLHSRKVDKQGTLVAAIVLAGLAALSLSPPEILARLFVWQAAWAPLLLGIAFAVVYFFFRKLGFIIPATILIAIGSVTSLPDQWFEGWMMFIALALAFAAVFAIHTRVKGITTGERIWPLFPAGGLLVFSLAVALSQRLAPHYFMVVFLGLPALALLAIYCFKPNMGLLIPGLMMGSVAGWFAVNPEQLGWLMLFLSISFFLIFLLETRKNLHLADRWWPIVPSLILLGNASLMWFPAWRNWFSENIYAISPGLILIGVGILVLLGRNKQN